MINQTRIVLCLGSNVGNRNSFLSQACEATVTQLSLKEVKRSTIMESKALLPEGADQQWDMDFLNLALSGNLDLDQFPPLKILSIIKKIEKDLGRFDRGRWGPREIDIDIAMIDHLRIDLGKELQIPHPELFKRDFFLKTIQEIEPKLLNQ